MTVPTYRYTIRGLSERETEFVVRVVWRRLPERIRSFGSDATLRPALEAAAARLREVDPEIYFSRAKTWRAWEHLKRVGAVERSGARGVYRKGSLPEDPLAAPSPTRCLELAAAIAALDSGTAAFRIVELVEAARR